MASLQSVDIIGGGPAGLALAILLKRRMPAVRIRVSEQNPADATFGFGVVFSDAALDFLAADEPETHALITPHMERWRNMTLVHRGEVVTLDGIGFAAIGRLQLLAILQSRARDVGVEMRFGRRIADLEALDADLVVGADGLNSVVRQATPEAFGETLEYFENRFAWFGTNKPFATLTQTFVATPQGAINAHHYRYTPEMSTFIVEATHETWKAYGFDAMDEAQSAAQCAEIFRETLGSAALITNQSMWRRFPRLWCNRWVHGNRVLIGDAAHTAHFSIGSGTRLAIEDAIALAEALASHADLGRALATFEAERIPVARKIVDAANTSAAWYDRFADKMELAPLDFAFDYVTRSGRVNMERLRQLAPEFAASYARHRANFP